MDAAATNAETSDVRCSQFGVHPVSDPNGDPAPCQHDDCACCPPVIDTIGLLPEEPFGTPYLPRLVAIVATPVLFGSLANSEHIPGQPRAPPTLI
ncbi:hypothetical protein CU048_03525 [Beijerinckiaceae bacterium]|nr:hypothetical protein CU048_03525 [Beijerinckiaceae bacterium]